jgi:2-acylglycerol O-acyltransferase 2
VLIGVFGILLLVGVLMGVNLVLGLLVASLYGLFPKEVLFESVASRLRNKQVEENIQATFRMECPEAPPPSCLFIWQPHGLISVSSVMFNGGLCTHPNYRPNHAVTLPFYHYFPVVGDIIRYLGSIPSDSGSITKTLRKGESVSVMLGGVREMLDARGTHVKLYIRKRTGIFRIALETGKPLVPVLTYGENEMFPRSDAPWATTFNQYLHEYVGMAVGIPTWKAFQNWFELSYKPLKPIVTHVGSPITATGDISSLRDTYIKAVEALFKKTAPPEYTLEIV